MATIQEINAVLTGFPRPLNWSSFRRVTSSPSPPQEAHLSSSYRMGAWRTVLERGAYRVGGFHITVTHNATASWAVPAAFSNTALLVHEQGHYDITGLIARDLARNLLDLALDATVVASMRDAGTTAAQHAHYAQLALQRSVDETGRKAAGLLNKIQSSSSTGADGLYDRQTDHGLNLTAQATWNGLLAAVKQGNEDFGFRLAIAGIV